MKKAIVYLSITFFFIGCVLNEQKNEKEMKDSSKISLPEEITKPISFPKGNEKNEIETIEETPKTEIKVNVSAKQMDKFYIGVQNPVTIEASGIGNDKLIVTISSGYIKKTTTGYIFRAKIPGETKLTVSAEIDGKIKMLKSLTFKVERIPNPIAKIGEKRDGKITISELLAAGKISTEMENFDFNVRFVVVRFTVASNIKGFNEKEESRGSRFTERQIALIKKVKSGNEIYFKDIKARGPEGSIRKLGTLAFTIQ